MTTRDQEEQDLRIDQMTINIEKLRNDMKWETRKVASFVLMNGLISRLLAKGILSTEDAKLIIDEAMLGLEERGGLSVPELKGAHALLSALWGIVQASSDSHPKSGE